MARLPEIGAKATNGSNAIPEAGSSWPSWPRASDYAAFTAAGFTIAGYSLTIHYTFTIHYSLFDIQYSLYMGVFHYSLFTFYYPGVNFANHHPLFTIPHSLFTMHCSRKPRRVVTSTPPSQPRTSLSPGIALCLGPFGCPRGWVFSYGRGTPAWDLCCTRTTSASRG